jgi:hypothetical protein
VKILSGPGPLTEFVIAATLAGVPAERENRERLSDV